MKRGKTKRRVPTRGELALRMMAAQVKHQCGVEYRAGDPVRARIPMNVGTGAEPNVTVPKGMKGEVLGPATIGSNFLDVVFDNGQRVYCAPFEIAPDWDEGEWEDDTACPVCRDNGYQMPGAAREWTCPRCSRHYTRSWMVEPTPEELARFDAEEAGLVFDERAWRAQQHATTVDPVAVELSELEQYRRRARGLLRTTATAKRMGERAARAKVRQLEQYQRGGYALHCPATDAKLAPYLHFDGEGAFIVLASYKTEHSYPASEELLNTIDALTYMEADTGWRDA